MTQAAPQLYVDGGRLAPPVMTREQARSAGMTRYFTGVPCKHGHITERRTLNGHCLQCDRDRASAKRAKDPAGHRQALRDRYAANRQKHQASEKLRRIQNPEAFKILRRENYRKNAKQIAIQRKTRRESDPIWAFNERARAMIRGAFSRQGFKKNSSTEAILGCTLIEFRLHIERQFLRGMTWENRSLWEIDHIVPASSAKTTEEAESINKAANLRPIWREENRSKGGKKTHLI